MSISANSCSLQIAADHPLWIVSTSCCLAGAGSESPGPTFNSDEDGNSRIVRRKLHRGQPNAAERELTRGQRERIARSKLTCGRARPRTIPEISTPMHWQLECVLRVDIYLRWNWPRKGTARGPSPSSILFFLLAALLSNLFSVCFRCHTRTRSAREEMGNISRPEMVWPPKFASILSFSCSIGMTIALKQRKREREIFALARKLESRNSSCRAKPVARYYQRTFGLAKAKLCCCWRFPTAASDCHLSRSEEK